MSFIRCTTLVAMFVAAIAVTAQAQTSANQTVTYSVSAINDIDVSGNPGALAVTSATDGVFDDATDATTTYAVSTNESNKKITAQLSAAMQTGLTLKVALIAPTNATSAGEVTLTELSATDVVTGITQLNEAGKMITYRLQAAANSGAVASSTKTVTFTIVAGV